MKLRTPNGRISTCVVAAILLVQAFANAQVSPKFDYDSFDDMNVQDDTPFSWRDGNSNGTVLDAASGDLVVEAPLDRVGFAAVNDFTYDDVSIRTQVSVPQQQPWISVGMDARMDFNAFRGYWAAITSSDYTPAPSSLAIGTYPDFAILAQESTELNPAETDVLLQFDTIGDMLSLSAWAEGSLKESAQTISVQDSSIQRGGVALEVDDGVAFFFPGLTEPTPATFRFFEVVPEPSAFGLTTFGLLGILCCRRRTAHSQV